MSVAAIQQFPPHRVVEPDGTPLAAGVLTELVASNLDEPMVSGYGNIL